MYKEYGTDTAKNYAAYRPPLHGFILDKALKENEKFDLGLDIGCGVGQSSVALLKYCKKIIGIEPSPQMLQSTLPHPNIEYQGYNGENLFFPDSHFDIITFAGSLFYCKSQNLLDQVIRVGSNSAIIIVYDFQIFLEDLLVELNIDLPFEVNRYNHSENFSGLRVEKLIELKRTVETIDFQVESSSLAHLILSLNSIYDFLVKDNNLEDPYPYLKERLDLLSNGKPHALKVNLYYAKYQRVNDPSDPLPSIALGL